MGIKQTHTYAELGLSEAAYNEIAAKLRDAGYAHAFMEDGAIDMHGIGVTLEHNPPSTQCPDCGGDMATLGHTSDCPKKAY